MISTMKNQRVAKRFSLKNRPWNYRGEGNANLVLALVEERKIVRLRKSSANEKRGEERIWLEVDFCQGIMLPLLSERFVHMPTVVRLPESELVELNEKLQSFRPVLRHNKGLYGQHAAIFPDLCLLPSSHSYWSPTFCVEVKPKQGWIPLPDRRLSKCTFCLNQYFKLKQGSIKGISQYCPLDLFSGDRDRMKRAIKALLHCPQNNFKMFKNGNLVYDDSTDEHFESILEDWFGFSGVEKLTENLTSVVVDALLSDFTQSENQKLISDSHHMYEVKKFLNGSPASPRVPKHLLEEEAQSLLPGPTCYKESEPLPPNCILSRILQIQKLDALGSEEVHRLYSSLQPRDDFAYVYDMLLSPRNIFRPVNSYLLATTAKDCSILIAFQKMPFCLTDTYVKDLNENYYNFNIGVSDLDPKPASCIEKHRKRVHDVVISCIDVLRSQSSRPSNFGINNILYQRGIYPQETFEQTKQYGVTILVSTDPKIKAFLNNILTQTKEWLSQRKIKKISLVIKNISTKETVECWDFNIEYERGTSTLKKGLANPLTSIENKDKDLSDKLPETGNKDLKEIQMEIRDVMLQICSTVTFLPLLDCLCSFDVLVYTFKDCEVPEEWNESEPCFIANCQQVQFKPFSTSLHRVDTAVSYKGDF